MVKVSFEWDDQQGPNRSEVEATIDIKPTRRSIPKSPFAMNPLKNVHGEAARNKTVFGTDGVKLPSIGEFIAELSINGHTCGEVNKAWQTIAVANCQDGYKKEGRRCIDNRGDNSTQCDTAEVFFHKTNMTGTQLQAWHKSVVSGTKLRVAHLRGSENCDLQAVPMVNSVQTVKMHEDVNFELPVEHKISLVNCKRGLSDCVLADRIPVHCGTGFNLTNYSGQAVCREALKCEAPKRIIDSQCVSAVAEATVVTTTIRKTLYKPSKGLSSNDTTLDDKAVIRFKARDNFEFKWQLANAASLPAVIRPQETNGTVKPEVDATAIFVFNASVLDRQEGNDTQFKLEFSATAEQNPVVIDPVDVKVAVRALPSIALSSFYVIFSGGHEGHRWPLETKELEISKSKVNNAALLYVFITAVDEDAMNVTSRSACWFVVTHQHVESSPIHTEMRWAEAHSGFMAILEFETLGQHTIWISSVRVQQGKNVQTYSLTPGDEQCGLPVNSSTGDPSCRPLSLRVVEETCEKPKQIIQSQCMSAVAEATVVTTTIRKTLYKPSKGLSNNDEGILPGSDPFQG